MANKYANLVGTNKIKDEYTKINTGFDGVETDINAVNGLIDAVDSRVDTIITTPISGTAAAQEVVDARVSAAKSKTFASLDARFEETEQEIASHLADNALHFFRDGGFLSGEVDFDLLTANRIYQLLTPTGTNAPTGVGYGILLYWTSGAYGLQMCVDVTSNKLLVRTNSGTWNTWVEK